MATLPDWITSISSVGALIAAAVAAGFAGALFRVEANRDQQRTVSERRAQASRIGAWVEHEERAPGMRTWDLLLCLQNSSAQPVYRVVVTVSLDGEEVDAIQYQALPPSTQPRRVSLGQPSAPPRRPVDDTQVEVSLAFTDSAGIAWRRGPAGALEEVVDVGD